MPRPQRQLVGDLFTLDRALGDVLRTMRDPRIGQIRLAWWRERLQEIDQGLVPAEPHLQGAARVVAGSGMSGAMLAEELVDRWESILASPNYDDDFVGPVAGRGAALFGQSALILGAGVPGARLAMCAGVLWAETDFVRHCADPDMIEIMLDVARDHLDDLAGTAEPLIRPLTMLGLLARRDLERWPRVEAEATPGRAWLMIRHKLTGKL
jgi:phytoene synthase